MKKPWKELTPQERSARMREAKAAKRGAPLTKATIDHALEVLSPKHGVMPTKRGVVVKAGAKPIKEEGFGRGWTQGQRDEVLRKINKPKE